MALQSAGHRVLLAHPERCPALHREPRIVESLVRSGVLTSVTAGSLAGRFGGQVGVCHWSSRVVHKSPPTRTTRSDDRLA